MENLTEEQKAKLIGKFSDAAEAFDTILALAEFVNTLSHQDINVKASGNYHQAGNFTTLKAEIEINVPNNLFR